MKSHEIRGYLLIAGTNANRIAALIGVSRQAVHQAILGQNASPRIRAAISNTIGKPASDIWPDATTNQEEA
jgi:DNA-binding transcriptional regulator YdaS (Cro superfamily)